MEAIDVPTRPFEGQKPGTSGLRKRVKVFQEPGYTENFIQSIFNAIPEDARRGATVVVGGDGRFFLNEAIQIIARIAAGNGIAKLVVGQNGILSTPAVSCIVRKRRAVDPTVIGAIILTASHNPGGPDADFGIKFNSENGGPAPESLTDKIYKATTTISSYRSVKNLGEVNIDALGTRNYFDGAFRVEVIDSVDDYLEMVMRIFDFVRLRTFVKDNPDFKFLFDAMNGVTGPYLLRILVGELGLPVTCTMNCEPKNDFGGEHPDPNLTYAKALVDRVEQENIDFAAAFDGDGDRNMIIAKGCFVNPSDSVAVIAANAHVIPHFGAGLKGLARSMPTSGALDRVAKKAGVPFFEVPTGWKFFGNLMDAGQLSICGEESFGTGSDHVREKDGVWAALAWLSIVASAKDIRPRGLATILAAHWAEFGRNYFSRYDYEEVDGAGANELVARLRGQIASGELKGKTFSANGEHFKVAFADDFEYVDPIDKSVSSKQGIRVVFEDGSRVIVRLSGTGSVGATVRVYVERYQPDKALVNQEAQAALKGLVQVALELSQLEKFTGRTTPTVIT